MILGYFENKYTCSGACRPALFYYSLDLSKGAPTKNCLSFLKEEIGASLNYLGIAALVCGFIMSLIWCC
jgi:hypothetical protein